LLRPDQPAVLVWLMGGGELIASLLDEQAIDEFVISVAPVFIGDGIPRSEPFFIPLHPDKHFSDVA
jgi:dihydrofolate reductase